MHFLLIQLFFIIFYEKVFAAIYNDPCITTCNSSGMICINGRCKCDSKTRLFWTGARCLSCPNPWALSETSCIGYYGIKLNWHSALTTCQDMQGDLISLRDNNILPLLYQVTGDNNRRKKRGDTATDKTVAWTSAHALELTNLGLYEWNDKSLAKFDSRHTWWCKMGIPNLGYYHPYQEPTRWVNLENNEGEDCVLFRRGKSSVPMVCLDDVFCDLEYPFVCERSEATAQKFFGPPPPSIHDGDIHGNSDSKPVVSPSSPPNSAGGYVVVTKPNTNNEHNSNPLVEAHASEPKKNTKTLIIIIIIGLLLLMGLLVGVFFFIKHRNAKRVQFSVGGNEIKDYHTSRNVQQSVKNDPIATDISDVKEVPLQLTDAGEIGLTLDSGVSPGNMDINIGNQKQQKNKKGGYSKQQFDEFE